MSSGKLRRERSRSQERHSHTEGHRMSSADQEDVPELNEEEYDEEWEHEWEDIDEIGSNNPNYHRPYGRNSHMKWRGRNQYRGQNRFQNWDYRNRSTGSDHGSDNSRKTGRKNHAEEEESLEMPPGEEMTNLKVKIQDGKRFAEPDEKNDFENVTGMKSQPRFFRGRGHRGYHNVSRDKWVPQFNNKRQFEPVDCREVLNRRKRHHPDTLESDLREKLLRKDSDLGDLREIIESRDTGPSDLMDIIEPPDLSLVEELGEDVGEIGRMEEINLKVPNEYYNDGIGKNRNYEIEDESGHYEFTGEEEATDDAPPDDVHEHHTQTETWPEDEWELGRRRSRERSFCRLEEWRGKRGHDNEWRGSRSRLATSEDRLDHPVSPKLSFDNHHTSVDRDSSRNRSGDGSRRSLSGNLREKNFVHAIRPRDLSWDSERNVGRILPMEGLPNFKTDSETRNNVDKGLRMTLREDGGRDFSQERSRKFDEDDERFPIGNQDHKTLKSPLSSGSRPLDRKIRSHRSGSRSRNSSREPHRIVSEKVRRSSERTRRTRSISGERRSRDASHERIRGVCRERNGSLLEKSKNCLFQSSGQKKLVGERNRTGDGDFRAGQRDNVNREIIQERGRLRDGERDLFGQGSRVGDRGMIQERRRSSNREIEDRQRGDDRITVRYTSSDFMRTRSLSRERDRGFDKNRKSSPVRGGARVTRWGPERNPWLPGHEPGAISGRDREKSPVWGGPRTPSVERFRDVGWQSGKSPDRNQLRSRERERSRSRERQRAVSADRTRGDSRGRQIQGRNNVKDKDLSRLKETDRRENIQETQRRRNFNLDKDSNVRQNRICEPGPKLMRHAEKETFTNMRVDRIHKREHEEDLCKDRAREKPRSPDNRSKKTSQVIRGDFKERFVREAEKSLKCSRQDEFIKKSGRENLQQEVSGGHSLKDSREWENIRDFQERRNPQPIIGLPFLDESRRPESTHDLKARGQDSGTPRSLQQSLDSSSGNRTKKDQSTNWRDSKNRQSYERSEGERHRSSQWSSPNRRSKPSDHPESNKSASHSMQSTSSSHHSSSNGKTDNDFWRRNLPSLGESHWNKPRSDLSGSSREINCQRLSTSFSKTHQSPREVIFLRGLARDVSDLDIRKDISACGLWPKDVRVVYDSETGVSRGLAFITFNSIDESTRWMELRNGVLNLRPNNHVPMEYSNPVSKDWECARCLTVNFKHRAACYQCYRAKEDCLDGWEETCPYPTNALLLRGLNPLTSMSDITNALKPRMIAQARLDGVKMGVDAKGRPRTVCFVQLTSVTDSMALHKSLISEPLFMDNNQVMVAYCQLDKLPIMDSFGGQLHPSIPVLPPTLSSAVPLSIHSSLQSNNIPVVPRSAVVPPPPKSAGTSVSTASIRSMLEGNYTEKDIPILAQYCASAYAKNTQEQAAYVRYYTKLYRDKLLKNQAGGK